ncbi:hypothetical protein KAR91_22130 [Candidatus Pacearchaeota archaeon]|nr:hypothetical protein [Candidatus Pacearchaeota archaeon]
MSFIKPKPSPNWPENAICPNCREHCTLVSDCEGFSHEHGIEYPDECTPVSDCCGAIINLG